MKKILVSVMMLGITTAIYSQNYLQGSVGKDAQVNKLDVWFKPNYNSAPGEYIQFLQFAIAIPEIVTNGHLVQANAVGVGQFAGMTFTQAAQSTEGTERVMTWVFADPSVPATLPTWTNGAPFLGIVVNFFGGVQYQACFPRMVDFTNANGGSSNLIYFAIVSNNGDRTNYPNLFVALPALSITGTYPNGDQYVETTQMVALPAGVSDFRGSKVGLDNLLSWTTLTETRNLGFELQRSLDGMNYSALTFINSLAPNGNSTSRLDYSFTDQMPPGEKQYYRLRQENQSGQSQYSNVVIVQREKYTMLSVDAIWPNPANAILNVRINSPRRQRLRLLITDMAGKTQLRREVDVDGGMNVSTLDIAKLASGNYLLRVVCDEGCDVRSEKFVKQ
jgi:hypothetical protein